MSAESQEILYRELNAYQAGDDPAKLRAAAAGHLGASRDRSALMALYATALDAGDHVAAQHLADELTPVNVATRIGAGLLPDSPATAGG